MGARARAQAKPSTHGPQSDALPPRGRHQVGSPRLAVNVADQTDIPYHVDYSAFGVPTWKGTGTANFGWIPFGFAGGLYDPDTALVRFGARDYDPQIGRWVSKDPIRFGGAQTNIYVYVNDDPVNFFDPNGLGGAGKAAAKTFGKWFLPPGLDKLADAVEYCVEFPRVCAAAAQAACVGALLLPIASSFESGDQMARRIRDAQADEINREMYQDATGTQSQDTLSGGESIDPYAGGTSASPGP